MRLELTAQECLALYKKLSSMKSYEPMYDDKCEADDYETDRCMQDSDKEPYHRDWLSSVADKLHQHLVLAIEHTDQAAETKKAKEFTAWYEQESKRIDKLKLENELLKGVPMTLERDGFLVPKRGVKKRTKR